MGTTNPVLLRAIELRRTLAAELTAVRENTDLILDAVTAPDTSPELKEAPDGTPSKF